MATATSATIIKSADATVSVDAGKTKTIRPEAASNEGAAGPAAEWCATALRDCQAWSDLGLRLSTTSNECARMFDASLRQLVSWVDCPQLGGLEKTMQLAVEADPTAILPRTFQLGLASFAQVRSTYTDKEYVRQLDELVAEAKRRPEVTKRERWHAEAMRLYAMGEIHAAAYKWERILDEHPLDLFAVKFAHDTYFFMGDNPAKRDSVARVLPHWDETQPCYSYLYGMLAFGLEECEQYAEAEKAAEKALAMQRHDTWAVHARTHCYEMQGQFRAGHDFMERTERDWNVAPMLACHNYWHMGLYQLEMGDFDAALSWYDREVGRRALGPTGSMLDMVDAVSLLWRLDMAGHGDKIGNERWRTLAASFEPALEDHYFRFNDAHMLVALKKAGREDLAARLHSSFREYAVSGLGGDNARISDRVGRTLMDGCAAYANGQYAEAAHALYNIRGALQTIGGSNAQRDVFTQTAILSCVRSEEGGLLAPARTMLAERKKLKPNSPISDRLEKKITEAAAALKAKEESE